MYELVFLGPPSVGGLVVGQRLPIPAAGIVILGERRPYQELDGAAVVELRDPTVSSGRHGHCRIVARDASVEIIDRGSDNGTWIADGGQVRRVGQVDDPGVVAPGAEISVGRCRFRLGSRPG